MGENTQSIRQGNCRKYSHPVPFPSTPFPLCSWSEQRLRPAGAPQGTAQAPHSLQAHWVHVVIKRWNGGGHQWRFYWQGGRGQGREKGECSWKGNSSLYIKCIFFFLNKHTCHEIHWPKRYLIQQLSWPLAENTPLPLSHPPQGSVCWLDKVTERNKQICFGMKFLGPEENCRGEKGKLLGRTLGFLLRISPPEPSLAREQWRIQQHEARSLQVS